MKKKTNVIHRTDTKLKVTSLTSSSHYKKGETFILEKDDRGEWIDKKKNTRHFKSLLRDPAYFKIESMTAAKSVSPAKTIAPKRAKHPTGGALAKQGEKRIAKNPPKGAAKKKPAQLVPKGDLFSGATEISMTANKISVTKKMSENKNGRFEQHEVRTYHDKTPANMRALQDAIQRGNTKKVTVKFK